ncbi:hypothetical protein CMI39_03305 [Candidatus Pacearchaeota archaeon]|nr:hypothetical protein [Candidatus Pacearchaeota archaeon]|tara:strand:+ start:161 stop:820 length:660 start_codon:yes stop_codon:yes gene_type:complete
MAEDFKDKTWNDQLSRWYDDFKKSGKRMKDITKIPNSTFGDYIHGRSKDIDKISIERRKALYELTKLECFKYEEPKIEMNKPKDQSIGKYLSKNNLEGIPDIARQGKKNIDEIINQITSQLKGREKLEAGLLKSQQYKPNVLQRTDAIIELLDVLSEEVDYFRTASDDEKNVLIKRLQKEPESFGYVTQMLNIIYSGKKIDSWMLMIQPPSKIKRLTKK